MITALVLSALICLVSWLLARGCANAYATKRILHKLDDKELKSAAECFDVVFLLALLSVLVLGTIRLVLVINN